MKHSYAEQCRILVQNGGCLLKQAEWVEPEFERHKWTTVSLLVPITEEDGDLFLALEACAERLAGEYQWRHFLADEVGPLPDASVKPCCSSGSADDCGAMSTATSSTLTSQNEVPAQMASVPDEIDTIPAEIATIPDEWDKISDEVDNIFDEEEEEEDTISNGEHTISDEEKSGSPPRLFRCLCWSVALFMDCRMLHRIMYQMINGPYDPLDTRYAPNPFINQTESSGCREPIWHQNMPTVGLDHRCLDPVVEFRQLDSYSVDGMQTTSGSNRWPDTDDSWLHKDDRWPETNSRPAVSDGHISRPWTCNPHLPVSLLDPESRQLAPVHSVCRIDWCQAGWWCRTEWTGLGDDELAVTAVLDVSEPLGDSETEEAEALDPPVAEGLRAADDDRRHVAGPLDEDLDIAGPPSLTGVPDPSGGPKSRSEPTSESEPGEVACRDLADPSVMEERSMVEEGSMIEEGYVAEDQVMGFEGPPEEYGEDQVEHAKEGMELIEYEGGIHEDNLREKSSHKNGLEGDELVGNETKSKGTDGLEDSDPAENAYDDWPVPQAILPLCVEDRIPIDPLYLLEDQGAVSKEASSEEASSEKAPSEKAPSEETWPLLGEALFQDPGEGPQQDMGPEMEGEGLGGYLEVATQTGQPQESDQREDSDEELNLGMADPLQAGDATQTGDVVELIHVAAPLAEVYGVDCCGEVEACSGEAGEGEEMAQEARPPEEIFAAEVVETPASCRGSDLSTCSGDWPREGLGWLESWLEGWVELARTAKGAGAQSSEPDLGALGVVASLLYVVAGAVWPSIGPLTFFS
ncbi:hypothetical protein GNI_089440 [Gregarina niphandrodes]|uniref:Uncharacterized protein n=1 Tax=Gregarina niphandrodes TaxID=110365 RepID=A0A023B5L8_GRENI|nr:hypothetical protein GNI_089440 [Gregarina niphandrodes]EZG61141.1 hypothetical protein GNI_089440 [Gregarina niphandrodes]|eukprot:XP_011130794.1 hypothetical protein GNI_089440 [Gregarina niphandrodes]